jgi:hypothetical protein
MSKPTKLITIMEIIVVVTFTSLKPFPFFVLSDSLLLIQTPPARLWIIVHAALNFHEYSDPPLMLPSKQQYEVDYKT